MLLQQHCHWEVNGPRQQETGQRVVFQAATQSVALQPSSCVTSFQVLYPLTMAQIMGPRYKAGTGRDDLDAELMELMGVVRLRWVLKAC